MNQKELAIRLDEMLILQLKNELKIKTMSADDKMEIRSEIKRLEKLNEERRKNL